MKKENFSKIFFFLLIFPSFSFTGVRIQTDCRVMCRGVGREGPSGGIGPQVLKQTNCVFNKRTIKVCSRLCPGTLAPSVTYASVLVSVSLSSKSPPKV